MTSAPSQAPQTPQALKTPQRGLLHAMRAHPRQALWAGVLAPLLGAGVAGGAAVAGWGILGVLLGFAVTLAAIPGVVWALTHGRG